MNDTQITLAGWLGTEVTRREASGTPVASFRVATTPRRFDKKADAWVDGDTQWYSVTAWRQLAENCAASLHSGDPVVLHGRLTAETWTNRAGIEVTSMEVEANFVGHDLGRGTSTFVRNTRADGQPVAGPGDEDGAVEVDAA